MKHFQKLFLIIVIACSTSCATILGGKVTDYQKTKPLPGQPQRQVRMGFYIVDILASAAPLVAGYSSVFFLPIAVDFATGAIYKREKPKK